MGLNQGLVQLLILAAIIALSITAEKFRQLVPEDANSRTRFERFQYGNCFDMKCGTSMCIIKGILKTYLFSKYEFENKVPTATFPSSFLAKYNTGAILAFGWDFLETVTFGGTKIEGLSRGAGAFFAAQLGGAIGLQWIGSFLQDVDHAKMWGFIAGSNIGSWFGGSTGLMVYDVVHGVNYLMQFVSKDCKSVCPGIPASKQQ